MAKIPLCRNCQHCRIYGAALYCSMLDKYFTRGRYQCDNYKQNPK